MTNLAKAAVAAVLTVVSISAPAAGPRLGAGDFFLKHLDTSIPALQPIPALVASGDTNAANRVFADYLRKTLRPENVNRGWLKRPYSEKERELLRREAADTMAYRLSSTGYDKYQFKNRRIDWESNPTFNKYREWTWQLSRMPFWTRLAEYYVLTGDEEAVRCWIDQIGSWFDQAQAPEHTNAYRPCTWRTIEAGIRMDGWSRQLHAFLRSPLVTDEFLVTYFRSIWEHGRRLTTASQGQGNWVVLEKGGLLRLAYLYAFFRESKEWYDAALARLVRELDEQIYPDGFQAELTTGYQGVITGVYGALVKMFRDMDDDPPAEFMKRFSRPFEMYPRLMMPDGRTPNLNDGSRVGVAKAMAKALEYFPGRDDWRWFATSGREGKAPDYLSCAFPWAGAAVMRTSWSKDAVWAYMDCSPFGMGHQHEDKLNVLMQAYGKDMLTEGGCYFYDTSDMRRYVLSTRSHNTVRIDGCDQFQMKTYRWNVADIAKKADMDFGTTPSVDWAEASYVAGYGEKLDKTVHSRRLVFFKSEKGIPPFFAVIDRLCAPDGRERKYEVLWHLEECALKISGRAFVADFGDGVGLAAAFSDSAGRFEDMKGSKEPELQGWMPIWRNGPHEHRPIPTPVAKGNFTGSRRMVTLLCPFREGACYPVAVESSPDVNDTVFEVVMNDGRRIVMDSARRD